MFSRVFTNFHEFSRIFTNFPNTNLQILSDKYFIICICFDFFKCSKLRKKKTFWINKIIVWFFQLRNRCEKIRGFVFGKISENVMSSILDSLRIFSSVLKT